MDTRRKGDQGAQVTQLQQLLTQRGYTAPTTGVFDMRTWQAVRAFQTQNLNRHGRPLVVDSAAGPLTWSGLQTPKPSIVTPTAVDYRVMPATGGSARGRAALTAAIVELKAGAGEQGVDNRSSSVQGFSYVLSHMDKLLGYGHVR
jgi:peptidoglycan hydrolase-like protein with peptidoglycan-binding domain